MDYLINFGAFCLPIALFGSWGLIGFSVLSLVRRQGDSLQNLLLAPVIGFSFSLLAVFTLNRAGFPLGQMAGLLYALFLVGSVALLFWRRPPFPVKDYLPFAGILFLALALVGYPLLKFGFNWISYGNDDMANYALGAMRHLNYGFYELPKTNDLIQAKDYSLMYWFWQVPDMIRPGCELILAWVSGVLKLNPLQIYMPLMLAAHLMLISTTGALIYTSRKNYSLSWVSCLVLSFSALTALGTYYQLIAQVIGLNLLIASLILACQPFTGYRKRYALAQGALIGAVLATLFIVYPELLPFLVLTVSIYFALLFWKGWRLNKAILLSLLAALVIMALLLNTHFLAVLEFFILQIKLVGQSGVRQSAIFPYFLIPSGFANLWGFLGLSVEIAEPYMSVAVISGAALFLVVCVVSLRLMVSNLFLPAIVSLVMICAGVDLFVKYNGFALFKLAMYAQPFFIAVIVAAVFQYIRKDYLKVALLALFLIYSAKSLHFYSKRSEAKIAGAFTEIAYGSTTKINQEYRKLVSELPANATLFSDDFNISLIKFQALQSLGHSYVPLTSPNNFIIRILPDSYYTWPNLRSKLYDVDQARSLAEQYQKTLYAAKFNLHDSRSEAIDFSFNKLSFKDGYSLSNTYMVLDTGLRSIFNRRSTAQLSKDKNFSLKKLSELHNHLVFIDSSLGRVYHSVIVDNNNMKHLSLFNVEGDFFFPGQSMQSVGRYLLMRVFSPTAKFRMQIALSNSYNGDGKNLLPTVSAVGNSRVKFPVMGRGSARVYSGLFSPQVIQGMSYVATDMGTEGISFSNRCKGIMRLYNSDLAFDSRKVASFVRDISLITEDEYQNRILPSLLQDFPKDLANRDLEYSGIYEDGWISENSYFWLEQPDLKNKLVIQGILPDIDHNFTGTVLTVLLDGKKLAEKQLKTGEFNIEIPLKAGHLKHKIELHFTKVQQLPHGDGRTIAVLIKRLGFA